MNFEIIAGIILAVSFLGIIWLVWRKMPEVKALPHREDFLPLKKIKDDVKQKTVLYWKGKVPDFYVFLQSSITKIRDLFVKADNKMLDLLLRLKKRTDKGKEELDDYWKDIKKTLKKKDAKKKHEIVVQSEEILLDKELGEAKEKIQIEERDKINLPPA